MIRIDIDVFNLAISLAQQKNLTTKEWLLLLLGI